MGVSIRLVEQRDADALRTIYNREVLESTVTFDMVPRTLEELVRKGSDHGFHTVIARIVGHHAASISLHAGCGFEHAGTEREVGRKFSQWLDVVLMQRML